MPMYNAFVFGCECSRVEHSLSSTCCLHFCHLMFSMVLADDLSGNGYMDLIVSTMNGNVYLLNTETKFHPLKTWCARVGLYGRWRCAFTT